MWPFKRKARDIYGDDDGDGVIILKSGYIKCLDVPMNIKEMEMLDKCYCGGCGQLSPKHEAPNPKPEILMDLALPTEYYGRYDWRYLRVFRKGDKYDWRKSVVGDFFPYEANAPELMYNETKENLMEFLKARFPGAFACNMLHFDVPNTSMFINIWFSGSLCHRQPYVYAADAKVIEFTDFNEGLKIYNTELNKHFDEVIKAREPKLEVILDITLPEKYREHFDWSHMVVFKSKDGYLWCSSRPGLYSSTEWLRDFMIKEVKAGRAKPEDQLEIFNALRGRFRAINDVGHCLRLDAGHINISIGRIYFDRTFNKVYDLSLLSILIGHQVSFSSFDKGLSFFSERIRAFFERESIEAKAKAKAAEPKLRGEVILDITLPEKYVDHFEFKMIRVMVRDGACPAYFAETYDRTYQKTWDCRFSDYKELCDRLYILFKSKSAKGMYLDMNAGGINYDLASITLTITPYGDFNFTMFCAYSANAPLFVADNFNGALKEFSDRINKFFVDEDKVTTPNPPATDPRMFFSSLADLPNIDRDRLKYLTESHTEFFAIKPPPQIKINQNMLSFIDDEHNIIHYSPNSTLHYDNDQLSCNLIDISLNGNDFEVTKEQLKKIHADLNLKFGGE